MLGGDIRNQLDTLPVVFDDVALSQIAQSHNQIVFRIDTEDFLHSRILWTGTQPGMGPTDIPRGAHKKRKAERYARLSIYNSLK